MGTATLACVLLAVSLGGEADGLAAWDRAGKGCDIPDFSLGRFPLVSADFWTSDHLSERSRSVDAFFLERARAEHSR
jgi:hypothetical protein